MIIFSSNLGHFPMCLKKLSKKCKFLEEFAGHIAVPLRLVDVQGTVFKLFSRCLLLKVLLVTINWELMRTSKLPLKDTAIMRSFFEISCGFKSDCEFSWRFSIRCRSSKSSKTPQETEIEVRDASPMITASKSCHCILSRINLEIIYRVCGFDVNLNEKRFVSWAMTVQKMLLMLVRYEDAYFSLSSYSTHAQEKWNDYEGILVTERRRQTCSVGPVSEGFTRTLLESVQVSINLQYIYVSRSIYT